MARATREEGVVAEDEGGKVAMLKLPKQVDYREPIPDGDGSVPEFVNVTKKTQIMTIPGNPGNPIRVRPFGILRGAQWRKTFATGKTPPFRERRRGKDGKLDPKYLLEADQVLEEIGLLGAIKPRPGEPVDETIMENKVGRIEALIENAVIGKNGTRLPDDRNEIVAEAQRRTSALRRLADKDKVKKEAAMRAAMGD